MASSRARLEIVGGHPRERRAAQAVHEHRAPSLAWGGSYIRFTWMPGSASDMFTLAPDFSNPSLVPYMRGDGSARQSSLE